MVTDATGRVLADLLHARTGQQLSMNRRWRVDTALKALCRERGFGSVDELMGRLVGGKDPALAGAIVESLLNNETFFFRDRGPFDLLMRGALPRLRAARSQRKRLSIWCAGCSTGQEAYSIAMAIAEDARSWEGWTVEIVATDISEHAIAQARDGLYSQFEVQRGLSVIQMMRWFAEEERQRWRIADSLRRAVRFEVHNLLTPPPSPANFDVILCRNVLLYFDQDQRRSVMRTLARASATDGVLMMGAGETIIGNSDEFVSDPDHRGLYLRRAADKRFAWREVA